MYTAIVLDLDETLIHTFNDTTSAKKLNLLSDPRHIGLRTDCYILDFYDAREARQYHMWGIRRPHLDDFLSFCFANFGLVIVWTAGSSDYADAIVNVTFKQSPHLIFSREHCREYKGHVVKPLKDLFDHEPRLSKLTSLNNMIMLDDISDNFIFNKPNGIVVQPFLPRLTQHTIESDDNVLKLAQTYLKELIHTKGKNIGQLDSQVFLIDSV